MRNYLLEDKMANKKQTWKWRSMVSFFLLFAGVVLFVSGVVLFIAPPGRIANAGWSLLGLDKGQWEAVHTVFGYLATAFAVFHLVLNWKVLLNYLRDRARKVYRLKVEFLIALALALVVGLGAAQGWPPFSNMMDFGESLKLRWESSSSVVPTVVTTEHEQSAGGGNVAGWGRYTVADLCEQYNVPLDEGLARLASAGVPAQGTSRVRTLADSSGLEPSAIVEIIEGKSSGN